MSKNEEYVVKKIENININLYAVRSQDGKWLRSKGLNGHGEKWVDDLSKAKIYTKPGPAKSQITYWGNQYPEYGVPDLVRITTGICEFLDQKTRVAEVLYKNKIKELEDKITSCDREISFNEKDKKSYQEKIERVIENRLTYIQELKKYKNDNG